MVAFLGENMNNFIKAQNQEIQDYLKILSPEFPEWLNDYINTPEMLKLDGISMSCGTIYCKVYNDKYFYSSLTHSIGVSLIVWHFTHDKKQTLAGLFHDIATPVFKHCIDFLNGDSEYQESTEELTENIIRDSKEIMSLLERDGIKVEEVSDYHIYPIADNDTPKLSADRFEYTMSGGLCQVRVFELEDIERLYNDVIVVKNEEGTDELAFLHPEYAEEFVNRIKDLWPRWYEDEDRLCMQYIADIIKCMSIKGYITVKDLYSMSEKDVIGLIENCKDDYINNAFRFFKTADSSNVLKSDESIENYYCTSVKGKKRYINPLTVYNGNSQRISTISTQAQNNIDGFLNMKTHKYIGFNYDFKAY